MDVTRQAKQRVKEAARDAVAADLARIEDELRAVRGLVEEVRTIDAAAGKGVQEIRSQVHALGVALEALRSSHDRHVPRPPGRPEFLAQYHLSDVLAWRAADASAAWAEARLLQAEVHATREQHLRRAAEVAPAEGLILEFGVGDGSSLRWLEDGAGVRRVVGFDSFEGLPEDWRTGFGKGAFDDVDQRPFERAELIVGWFEDTLPAFLQQVSEPIALLHVDCDLYSSTVTVLEACIPRLAPGGIVAFDEFLNYPGWHLHEARAWDEAITAHQLAVEYVGYVPSWEQVSARVGRNLLGSQTAG